MFELAFKFPWLKTSLSWLENSHMLLAGGRKQCMLIGFMEVRTTYK